ncbi:Protein of unknown function [Pedobacter sp. ok626]|uniref:glycosyltransferase family 87 protein n=1 Tax=Pedobacter sp. ok626 TaxID=1761882 RepID=UPI0008908CF4|nr:glycosyltransferase family 87 protein [Pedobacter sp. ok626]SDK25426.1 Protein of unknown function [Pedobacter sp. ok626]
MTLIKSLLTTPSSFKLDRNKTISLSIWLLLAVALAAQSLITHRYNNYLIFENTFRNLINQTSFYAEYPQYHFDSNHYGPVFSVFFMPFALLPNGLGLFLWDLFTTLALFFAINTLPLKKTNLIFLIAIPCLISSLLSEQSNPLIASIIILSYTQLNKKRGLWSTLFIVLGTFIKLYGIVGLAFFLFVKDKKRFVLYLLMWAVVFFVLPMFFSSPEFIINSYKGWAVSLTNKNAINISDNNISIMGFLRGALSNPGISNLTFLMIGGVLFLIPYLNFKRYADQNFQLLILASTLMFTVLFSTGSEDCTYIIAIPGVGIWYLLTEKKIWKHYLLGLVVIFSCSFPQFLFHSLALKYPMLSMMLCVPFFVVWLLTLVDAYNLKTNESNA